MTVKFFPIFFARELGVSPVGTSAVYAVLPLFMIGAGKGAQRLSLRLGRVQACVLCTCTGSAALVALWAIGRWWPMPPTAAPVLPALTSTIAPSVTFPLTLSTVAEVTFPLTLSSSARTVAEVTFPLTLSTVAEVTFPLTLSTVAEVTFPLTLSTVAEVTFPLTLSTVAEVTFPLTLSVSTVAEVTFPLTLSVSTVAEVTFPLTLSVSTVAEVTFPLTLSVLMDFVPPHQRGRLVAGGFIVHHGGYGAAFMATATERGPAATSTP
eukprot:gene1943-11470_t